VLRLGAAILASAAAGLAVAPHQVTVTRDSLALPRGCAPRDVAGIVSGYLDRLAQPEAIALEEIDVGAAERHSASIRFRIDRAGQKLDGTGTVDCAAGQISSWTTRAGSVRPPSVCGPLVAGSVTACSRAGRRPTAQDSTADFSVAATPVALPTPCGPAAVRTLALELVRAFDVHDGKAFAARLTPDTLVQPFTGTRPFFQLVGRAAAARFVSSRRAAHVGLTAAKLEPELVRSEDPRTAVYLVDLTRGTVKLVVNCRTGLVRIWVGPGLRLP